MKLKDTISAVRQTPDSRRGIALVITLIMLTVITFLTVAFLILSQRQRGSVTTTTDQLIARQAADSGLERAKMELLAPMLALTNDQVYDMIVSTNFINPNGFVTGNSSFTNVNYQYANGSSLGDDDSRQNLANLLYNPRPPVLMTNPVTGSNEFRYYLDLNRNGVYDPNGLQPVRGYTGYIHPNGVENSSPVNAISNFFMGDPEWIGVLQHPDMPHSSSNRFIGRYAYLVVPASKTLDVNYIHNYAKRLDSGMPDDGFLRDQGVGSYEINLAAFLADLNTNIWNPIGNIYDYHTNNTPSRGLAFQDALDLLKYRYSLNGSSQSASYANLGFGLPLDNEFIDEYANGITPSGIMTGTKWANDINDNGSGFPGGDNPTHFFTTQEFFDRAKLANNNPLNFADHLNLTRTTYTNSSYDRYTYYRMLAQLGTDSEPDRRMNLNYMNVDVSGNVVPGMETNLISWGDPRIQTGIPGIIPAYGAPGPLIFFTNAADRLLAAQFPGLSVTNIPVFLNGNMVYSPAVNRLLQLAANMYEATTNTLYPTLFRPYFSRDQNGTGTNVYITGFEQVTDPFLVAGNSFFSEPIDLSNETLNSITNTAHVNIYGIPWIIGARKGFPNFNEVSAQSIFNITRRVEAIRPTTNSAPVHFQYRQQLLMDVSSAIGIEAWNSYHFTNFLGAQVQVSSILGYELTNSQNVRFVGVFSNAPAATVTSTTAGWPGYGPTNASLATAPDPASFLIPLRTNYFIVHNRAYLQSLGGFVPTNSTASYEPVPLTPVQWGLSLTNHVRVILCDASQRVFDYVQLRGPVSYRNLSQEILTTGTGFQGLWNTNLSSETPQLPEGVANQIHVSLGDVDATESDWKNNGIGPLTTASRDAEIAGFRAFYYAQAGVFNGITVQNPTNLTWQVPYTPMRTISQLFSWQANDPLVHYTAGDLVDLADQILLDDIKPPGTVTNFLPNIGQLNNRYSPWGGRPMKTAGADTGSDLNAFNTALKDPGVQWSDNWDFPTNKFPNIGWLGRVHRGTPWQTVYMKSEDIAYPYSAPQLKIWSQWTGSDDLGVVTNTIPIKDRLIFDLFTAEPNENAGRGRLPVNQSNLAAWSAVLSGVSVLTNITTGQGTIIQPAALSPQVAEIVQSINLTRAATNIFGNVFPGKEFAHIGDVLATPQLSEYSPFLTTTNPASYMDNGINDEVMERIPQQIMSLLSLSHAPRFVIYSYGQTLRPAPNSIYTGSGAFFQMCTNYQVTAESATRAVVHVEGSFNRGDTSTNLPSSLRYPPRIVVDQFNNLPPD